MTTKLTQGWNTWNTHSILSYVHLPSGFAFNLCWKQHYWLAEKFLKDTLIGKRGDDDPIVTPSEHPFAANYTKADIAWKELRCTVQTAKIADDIVVLITPTANIHPPVKLIIESGMLWNMPGKLYKSAENAISADIPESNMNIYSTQNSIKFPAEKVFTPYLTIEFTKETGISSGKERSLNEIKHIISQQKEKYNHKASQYEDLAEVYKAVQAAIGWNTIYDPLNSRIISTVGRLWNEEYGGYCLFGWDNFFLAYMTALDNRDLAFANILEHLAGATSAGFIPNDNRGNGCKSFDRSQPPVGSIMVKEIYKRYPEKWFLKTAFPALLQWNRWWLKHRLNGKLLSYGSSPADNPYNEPHTGTIITAKYESGMDDSPIYANVPYNAEKQTMELHDVGLNCLYIADCNALIEMAEILDLQPEKAELFKNKDLISSNMESLWDEETGCYLNKHTDTGKKSYRLSPTMFYPLLARIVSPARAARLINEHLLNPDEFAGEWLLPSIARNDASFIQQKYWKGAIWAPLNFLVYLGLRNYSFPSAQKELAEKSKTLFLNEWNRKGYICENYSSITGTGDAEHLSSDRFHSWGALLGIISFIEEGYMPSPEDQI